MKYPVVSEGGRVVIPAMLRKKYRIRKGMRVAFREEVGKLIIEPIGKGYFDGFAGILETKGKAVRALLSDRRREREL